MMIKSILCVPFILVVALSSFQNVVFSEEPHNPTPCTDPYRCVDKPVIYGDPHGTAALCPGASGSWSISGGAHVGTKEKCDEGAIPCTPSDVAWSYAVAGPEPKSGSGASFTWSPTEPGKYTITWTGTATADPCDVAPFTKTFPFKVYEEEFDPKLDIKKSLLESSAPIITKAKVIINKVPFLISPKVEVTGEVHAKGGRKCCNTEYVVFAEGGGTGAFSAEATLYIPVLAIQLPPSLTQERVGTILGYDWTWKPDFALGLTGKIKGEGTATGAYKVIKDCANCFTITVTTFELSGVAYLGGNVGGKFIIGDNSLLITGRAGWEGTTGVKLGDAVVNVTGGSECPQDKEMELVCFTGITVQGGYSASVQGVLALPGDFTINIGPYDLGKQTDPISLIEGTCP